MASKSAAEVFSSPEAKTALAAGAGFIVAGPVGAVVAGGAVAGAEAAKQGQKKLDKAFDTAQGLQTKVENSSSSTVKGTNTATQQTTFAPASKTEQELRDASISNFKAQQDLVDQSGADIAARGGVQGSARDALGNILGGGAFDLTPGEQARINALRQSSIDVGSNAVNDILNQRLGDLSADNARRGLRGQAVSQLQTGVLSEAAKSLERQTLAANQTAAQQAISMPGQRVGIQAGTAGQFADFADLAKQQAITNRQALQDPIALHQMLDERLKGGTTTSTNTTDQTTTGLDTRIGTGEGAVDILKAQAQVPSAFAGGFAGAAGAATAAANVVAAGAEAKNAGL